MGNQWSFLKWIFGHFLRITILGKKCITLHVNPRPLSTLVSTTSIWYEVLLHYKVLQLQCRNATFWVESALSLQHTCKWSFAHYGLNFGTPLPHGQHIQLHITWNVIAALDNCWPLTGHCIWNVQWFRPTGTCFDTCILKIIQGT
jgi:hypothetical protein